MTKINDRLSCTFDRQTAMPEVGQVADELARMGVVVVNNYLGKERVDRIVRKVYPEFERITRQSTEGVLRDDIIEEEKYVISFGGLKYADYVSMAARKNKTVVTVRRERDSGMLDAFDVDRMFPDLWNDFAPIREEWVEEAASLASGRSFTPRNLNLYFSKSVRRTRRFHVDSWGGHQLKAFVYLTDVLEEQDGPHAYIVGSHKHRMRGWTNRMLNVALRRPRTDCAFYAKDNVRQILGPRGTLLLSFQNGVHRGLPQNGGRERIVLVQNYRTR